MKRTKRTDTNDEWTDELANLRNTAPWKVSPKSNDVDEEDDDDDDDEWGDEEEDDWIDEDEEE